MINKREKMVKYENVYFINGTAFAGKSTIVKELAKKYNAVACEENYHNALLANLDKDEFPGLTYTRDLKDWRHFIRRTPDEYEKWIDITSKECEKLELEILDELVKHNKMIFVDTNISIEMLHQISDKDHVLIMLAAPDISVNRFFNRPDKEKQFLYRLLMSEENPDLALSNFRQCLKRINNQKRFDAFFNSGFNVIIRDDQRSIDETVQLAEKYFKLKR